MDHVPPISFFRLVWSTYVLHAAVRKSKTSPYCSTEYRFPTWPLPLVFCLSFPIPGKMKATEG